MRILVIDDDTEVRQMIYKMLNSEGFDVVKAADGKEGMKIIKDQQEIKLVITDLIMPEKEGIETIQEIRKNHSDIKILAISGGGQGNVFDYLRIAKGLGADLTLSKPFVKQELMDAVKQLLPGN